MMVFHLFKKPAIPKQIFCALVLLLTSSLWSCQRRDTEVKPTQERTPEDALWHAVINNEVDTLGTLLNAGKVKDINWVKGQSLLQVAFDNYAFEIAEILLGNGADPNVLVLHEGKKMPLLQCMYYHSLDDHLGYHSLMIGTLLDYGADTSRLTFEKGLFIEILEGRVMVLAEHGDLIFTNWLYLLHTIFKQVCIDGDKIHESNLAQCKGWIARMQKFFAEVKRNRVVALRVGDIDHFSSSFDLCPHNEAKISPDAFGCN